MNYTQNKLKKFFNRKVLVISALGLLVAFAVITAISQTEVLNITNNEGEEVFSVGNDGRISGFGVVPIGSLLPWHKSFANTPALPNGWVECNGQVLSDPRSPYNGQTIPDLNGGNRFLRGNTTSGGTGGSATHDHGGATASHTLTIDEIPSHNHSIGIRNDPGDECLPGPGNGAGWKDGAFDTSSTGGGGGHSHNITSANQLPPYFDVVWIMRVK